MMKSIVLAIALIGFVAVVNGDADAMGYAWFSGDSGIQGELHLSQAVTGGWASSDVNYRLRVVGLPANAATQVSVFVHKYGDLFTSNAHGDCLFNTNIEGNLWGVSGEETTITGTVQSLNLTGFDSAIGRSVAIYVNLTSFDCTAATAATPAARGVIGIKFPGTGKTAADNSAENQLSSSITSAFASVVGSTGQSEISGEVYFVNQGDGTTQVTVLIKDSTQGTKLTNGNHAIHVHEFGDLSFGNATSAGGHWNPFGKYHGAPSASWKHAGDMGNHTANGGWIFSRVTIDSESLAFTGSASLIGRAVVLHTLLDDGNPLNQSTSVGNAGGRLARGVIGISNRSPSWISSSTGEWIQTSSSATVVESSTGISGTIATASLSVIAIVIAAIVAMFQQ